MTLLENITVIYRDKTCLFSNRTLNNVFFTFFMKDGFLTARKHIVIILITYKFIHMNLYFRYEYLRRKEVSMNLFARLRNVFNLGTSEPIEDWNLA